MFEAAVSDNMLRVRRSILHSTDIKELFPLSADPRLMTKRFPIGDHRRLTGPRYSAAEGGSKLEMLLLGIRLDGQLLNKRSPSSQAAASDNRHA